MRIKLYITKAIYETLNKEWFFQWLTIQEEELGYLPEIVLE